MIAQQSAGSNPPVFPTVTWGSARVTFRPEPAPLAQGGSGAVVAFAVRDGRFLLADIPGRGWCTPSGHVEAGETAPNAALRETREEVGAELADVRDIGRYRMESASGEVVIVPAFVGRVTATGPLPPGSESRGVRWAALDELPALYWMWDPLLAAMFTYAAEVAVK